MKIKPYVSEEEMFSEVEMWNNSGLSYPSEFATLKYFMLVEDENSLSPKYKYHIYIRENSNYRLINRKSFDCFLVNEDGNDFGEEPEDLQSLI
jgi:hypothetical protein